MGLTIKTLEKDRGAFLVSISGSLDTSTYEMLEQKLTPLLIPSTKALVLDLKGLEYISSLGVSVVLKAKRVMEERGGSFAVSNLTPQIKAVFDIIKALPDICVFESLQEADQYLMEMQKRAKEKGVGQEGDYQL